MHHRYLLATVAALTLAACSKPAEEAAQPAEEAPPEVASADAGFPAEASARLAEILAAQPDEVKARYVHRHPQKTIEFFGIEPGMTVLEGLPGRGWYTKVLAPYLGSDGHVVGSAYSLEMYRLFPFASEEFMERQQNWTNSFPGDVAGWAGDDGASASAFHFGSMPEDVHGTVDAVFFPRVLHNLARFQNEGRADYLTIALTDAYNALKPGGIMGIVQHEAREEMPDDWAFGGNGYIKKSFVIEQMEAVGFEFVAESAINENPNDQPTTEDVVWRLPPSYRGAGDDAGKRAAVDAIGESNRMTLKFRKPL
ncbi:MAG: hypothetical protein QNJ00_06080 [Woeseiaceae bacterium]|nr:hypothetical protein [Woeseiaceae bacterium]